MTSTSSKSIAEKLVKDDASSDHGTKQKLQNDGQPIGGFLGQIFISIIHQEAWIRSLRNTQIRMMTTASSATCK